MWCSTMLKGSLAPPALNIITHTCDSCFFGAQSTFYPRFYPKLMKSSCTSSTFHVHFIYISCTFHVLCMSENESIYSFSLSWTKALSEGSTAAGAAPQRSPPRVTQLRYISVLSLANYIISYISYVCVHT